jgi:hypothetical protein
MGSPEGFSGEGRLRPRRSGSTEPLVVRLAAFTGIGASSEDILQDPLG